MVSILIAAILILAFSGSCAKSKAAAVTEPTPTATIEATAEPTATPEAVTPTDAPEETPEETPEADVTALTAALNEFLDGLEPADRKLFVGRYWHLYPVSKLAAAYGLTTNNTSVKLHRLRERLREHLTERGFPV